MRLQALNLLLKLFDKLQLELNKNLFLKKWHWRLRKRHSLLPGESGFPLSHFYAQAKSSAESEELRKYMTQLRREIGFRLAEKVFDPALAPDGKPSKWWTCFSKRNFLKAPLIAWRIDFFLNLLYWSVIFSWEYLWIEKYFSFCRIKPKNLFYVQTFISSWTQYVERILKKSFQQGRGRVKEYFLHEILYWRKYTHS